MLNHAVNQVSVSLLLLLLPLLLLVFVACRQLRPLMTAVRFPLETASASCRK
jgi:hypothetical protein